MPNACPTAATARPMLPSPTTPRVRPRSPNPTVCCHPPPLTEASSAATCLVTARISAQVSSAVAPALPRVPHTVTPAAAQAATSMEALRMPVVTSSRRLGSSAIRSAVNGVRSRIATITSNGRSSAASSPVSAMWLAKVTTGAASESQSAQVSATSW